MISNLIAIKKAEAISQLICLLKVPFQNIDIVLLPQSNIHRLKARGFNHLEILFDTLIRNNTMTVEKDGVERVKQTKALYGLNHSQRQMEVSNAFILNSNCCVKNKNVLIVDDIVTTGSTISELALVCKKNKAKDVYALTLCAANEIRDKS